MISNANSHNDNAIRWLALLRAEPLSATVQQDFALWLAASPGNKAQFDAVLSMWEDLAVLKHLPEQAEPQPQQKNRRWTAGFIAVAASLLMAVVIWQGLVSDPDIPAIYYRTAMGEQRSIHLEEGSVVTLNTNSSLSVRLSPKQRYFSLNRGEAYFEVAKDPSRPFVVDVGSATVTALGTAFNIHRTGNASQVTVTEGTVRVKEKQRDSNPVVEQQVLTAGQSLAATAESFQLSADIDIPSVTAWQRGEIIANGMPLSQLVKAFSRYQDTHIIIGNPELADMTVSGVFRLYPAEDVLKALETTHHIVVDRVDNNTIRLLKAVQ